MGKIFKVFIEVAIIMVILQIGIFISGVIKPVIYIPGSIVGMILLFILLSIGVLKIHSINLSGNFLLKHMGFFFIPLGVSLLNSVDILKSTWIQLSFIIVVSGFLVMLVSSKVTDICIELGKRREG